MWCFRPGCGQRLCIKDFIDVSHPLIDPNENAFTIDINIVPFYSVFVLVRAICWVLIRAI